MMIAEMYKILLAEDDPNDAELTLNGLEQYNLANRVVVVHDGAEALDYVYRRNQFEGRPNGNPAVILLDLKMPKVNGIEVLEQLRGDETTKKIPIVVLTSSKEEPDIARCYELGVNAYVVKPVDFKQFVDAIKEVGLFWAVINQPPPM